VGGTADSSSVNCGAAARQGVAYSKSGPVVTLADVDFDLDHAKTQ